MSTCGAFRFGDRPDVRYSGGSIRSLDQKLVRRSTSTVLLPRRTELLSVCLPLQTARSQLPCSSCRAIRSRPRAAAIHWARVECRTTRLRPAYRRLSLARSPMIRVKCLLRILMWRLTARMPSSHCASACVHRRRTQCSKYSWDSNWDPESLQ